MSRQPTHPGLLTQKEKQNLQVSDSLPPRIIRFDHTLFRKARQVLTLPKDSILWPIISVHIEEPFDGSPTQLLLGTLATEDRYGQFDLIGGTTDTSAFSFGSATGTEKAFIGRDRDVFLKLKVHPSSASNPVIPTRGDGWLLYTVLNLGKVPGFTNGTTR